MKATLYCSEWKKVVAAVSYPAMRHDEIQVTWMKFQLFKYIYIQERKHS